jgi:Holliday junction DNA helicase RuvB
MPSTAIKNEIDPALRPVSFDTYIGQRAVIDGLCTAVRASKRGGWQLDHQLFTGGAGLGKTSIAQVVATELGARLRVTCATAIEHKGQLAALLTTLTAGDVLFIDEIHALTPALQLALLTAMEDRVLDLPAGNRVIRVPLQPFTLLGATTHTGLLSAPLRDRFGAVWQLEAYSVADLAIIIANAAGKLGMVLDNEAALEIGRRSRGTPRLALRLLRRVRDAAEGAVDASVVKSALDRIGVDSKGLTRLDLSYLRVVSESAMGLEALASRLNEQKVTIESVEGWLVAAGLVSRTRRGRVVTEAGKQHLAGVI